MTTCGICGGRGILDSGAVTPWGEWIDVGCPACSGTGKEPSICVYDFAGNGVDVPDRWADYWPRRNCVTFGGAWEGTPDMPADHEPAEDAVLARVAAHKGEGVAA